MLKQFWNILFPVKCVVCGDTLESVPLCARCRDLPVYLESQQLNLGYKYCGVFLYEEKARKIISAIKYQCNRELIPYIQKLFLEKAPVVSADLIIPVPLNPLRLQKRGFNQAEEFVRLYANYHGIEMRGDIVYRAENTQKLAELSPTLRRQTIQNIFKVWENQAHKLKNKRILIVDDIITTGTTIKSLADTIQNYQPASIEILGVFRPK